MNQSGLQGCPGRRDQQRREAAPAAEQPPGSCRRRLAAGKQAGKHHGGGRDFPGESHTWQMSAILSAWLGVLVLALEFLFARYQWPALAQKGFHFLVCLAVHFGVLRLILGHCQWPALAQGDIHKGADSFCSWNEACRIPDSGQTSGHEGISPEAFVSGALHAAAQTCRNKSTSAFEV